MIYKVQCNLKLQSKDKLCVFEKCEFWNGKHCSLNQMLAVNASYMTNNGVQNTTNMCESISSNPGLNITISIGEIIKESNEQIARAVRGAVKYLNNK